MDKTFLAEAIAWNGLTDLEGISPNPAPFKVLRKWFDLDSIRRAESLARSQFDFNICQRYCRANDRARFKLEIVETTGICVIFKKSKELDTVAATEFLFRFFIYNYFSSLIVKNRGLKQSRTVIEAI